MRSDPPPIDGLIDELRRAGHRATTARRAVLAEIVAAGDTHMTAEELGRRIQRRHPHIHVSTVYRTLDALTEAGLISRAGFADQRATYHLASDVHHHAVCTSCGATINLPPAVFEPVRRRLRRDHGFEAEPQHLTIAGRCRACAGA